MRRDPAATQTEARFGATLVSASANSGQVSPHFLVKLGKPASFPRSPVGMPASTLCVVFGLGWAG